MNYSTYCQNQMTRQNASFLYSPDGTGIYLVEGEYMSVEEFNSRFPVNERLEDGNSRKSYKGENPDRKHDWKSY